MARAYGSSAHLLVKRETVYGQAATGNYPRVPFTRCTLGGEQGLIDGPVLGQGRDPLAPLQDVITDEGDLVVPVDPRYHGGLAGLGLLPDEVPIIARRGELVVPHERVVREERTTRERAPVTAVVNVTTADANSFRAGQGQIAAEMARAIDRAGRNR